MSLHNIKMEDIANVFFVGVSNMHDHGVEE